MKDSPAKDQLEKSLRDYSPARVALPRAGASIATSEILDFQLAHAQARDAVHADFDLSLFTNRLREEVKSLGGFHIPVIALRSAAPDRASYIRRPELGRMLDAKSAAQLTPGSCDVAFVIGDGLSAQAPERHAIPVLLSVLPKLLEQRWSCGPVCIVKNARVAIGDHIGALLEAAISVVLIGERPGLSSPDSLGAYITWNPRPGRVDAERNCISNIRVGGLSYAAAAARLIWYLNQARHRRLTGTTLKESDHNLLE